MTLNETEIAARWDMFGPPPILRSENNEAYYKLRNAFVGYFRPKDTDTGHGSGSLLTPSGKFIVTSAIAPR